jgi:hypothetical protein
MTVLFKTDAPVTFSMGMSVVRDKPNAADHVVRLLTALADTTRTLIRIQLVPAPVSDVARHGEPGNRPIRYR